MVNRLLKPSISWLAPSPFWGDHAKWLRVPNQQLPAQPQILRFATDTFMDDLMATLTHSPSRIHEWIVRDETWREPMKNPKPVLRSRSALTSTGVYNQNRMLMHGQSVQGSAALASDTVDADFSSIPMDLVNSNEPVKLYQAGHQRHYLVTASLISDQSSYPDYLLKLVNKERASFVMRALVPREEKLDKITNEKSLQAKNNNILTIQNKDDTARFRELKKANETRAHVNGLVYDEYAYVKTPAGMAWRKVGLHDSRNPDTSTTQRLLANEDQLPVFPITYKTRCGRNRQILGGLIPVSKREELLTAPTASELQDEKYIAHVIASDEGGNNHIKEIFQADVIEPWKALIEQAEAARENLNNTDHPFFPESGVTTATKKMARVETARSLKTIRDQLQTGSWYVLLDFALFIKQFMPDLWEKMNGNNEIQLSGQQGKLLEIINETTLSLELSKLLAVENLYVANTQVRGNIWDELVDMWALERALGVFAWPTTVSELDSLYSNLNHDDIDEQYAGRTFDYGDIYDTARERMTSNKWFTLIDLFIFLEKHIDLAEQYTIIYRREPLKKDAHRDFIKQDLAIGDLMTVDYFNDSEKSIDFTASTTRAVVSSNQPATEYDLSNLTKSDLDNMESEFRAHLETGNEYVDFVIDDNPDILQFRSPIKEFSLGYLRTGRFPHNELTLASRFEDDSRFYNFRTGDKAVVLYRRYPLREFALGKLTEDKLNTDEKAIVQHFNKNSISLDDDFSDALVVATNLANHKIEIKYSLQDALLEIMKYRESLETLNVPYDRKLPVPGEIGVAIDPGWPHFIFPLADADPGVFYENIPGPAFDARMLLPHIDDDALQDLLSGLTPVDRAITTLDYFTNKVAEILNETESVRADYTHAEQAPLLMNEVGDDNVKFVVRCVFQRPECGALFPPMVSMATRQIIMAPFFDPDAPQRTVRISLPIDISPAGLRKFKKNTQFLISGMLCGKIKKIRKLTLADIVLSVLPWPFHKDLPEIGPTGSCSGSQSMGLFCSLSIPIVTLCALIMLLIIANLFDMFFRWIPALFRCFSLK